MKLRESEIGGRREGASEPCQSGWENAVDA